MKPNQLNAGEVLDILRRGLDCGTMLALDKAFPGLVEHLTHETVTPRFRNASEYKVNTYVMSDDGCGRGIVVKVVPWDSERLVAELSREFVLLGELYSRHPSSFRIPVAMALFALDDVFVSVTELLQGDYLTEMELTESRAYVIARTINDIQHALSDTSTGRTLLVNRQGPYYAKKAHQFIGSVTTDQHVDFGEMDSEFAALETIRQTSPVVVSDRSPANFIMCKNCAVGVFDFGLFLAGVPHEDWSLFIDDPRLRTSLTRNELIAIFTGSTNDRHGEGAKEMFHRAAVFVNIKQYCLMVQAKRSVAGHYLSRARQSAEALCLDKIVRLIGTLQSWPTR